jgi:magnesium-transporting ATPase (P-type)
VAIQLLWINLVTDGLPALALGFDPYDKLLMKFKPRPINEPIVNKNFLITMIYRGVILTIVVLGLFELYDSGGWLATTSVSAIPSGMKNLVQIYTNNTSLTDAEFLLGYNEWKARSVTFLVMMFSEMFNAFNCRSEYQSLFKLGMFSNKFMWVAVGSSSILTALLYIPNFELGVLFKVIPLTWEWLWLIPDAIIVIGCVELLKIYFRKQMHL